MEPGALDGGFMISSKEGSGLKKLIQIKKYSYKS